MPFDPASIITQVKKEDAKPAPSRTGIQRRLSQYSQDPKQAENYIRRKSVSSQSSFDFGGRSRNSSFNSSKRSGSKSRSASVSSTKNNRVVTISGRTDRTGSMSGHGQRVVVNRNMLFTGSDDDETVGVTTEYREVITTEAPDSSAEEKSREPSTSENKQSRSWFSSFFGCFKPSIDDDMYEYNEDGSPCLLPRIQKHHIGLKTLILDLDETLVHSSFSPVPNADFIIPVEIEEEIHNVYVLKRPGVDQFLKLMGEIYEVIVFTASLAKYADPVMDLLDKHNVISYRLFRESCVRTEEGNYVKDLSLVGRDLRDTIIIDNSPIAYLYQPENAIPIGSWFEDVEDTELVELIPFLEALCDVDDVKQVLDNSNEPE